MISDEYAKNNKANKASLSFVLEHKPGALAHVLDVFAKQSLNMVKIESRPLRHRNFEYRFYVDFAGEGLADLIEPAVQEIKAYCSQMNFWASTKMDIEMEKIYLTGMMGCGKSAIGRKLASKLERKFVDLDALIEQREENGLLIFLKKAAKRFSVGLKRRY